MKRRPWVLLLLLLALLGAGVGFVIWPPSVHAPDLHRECTGNSPFFSSANTACGNVPDTLPNEYETTPTQPGSTYSSSTGESVNSSESTTGTDSSNESDARSDTETPGTPDEPYPEPVVHGRQPSRKLGGRGRASESWVTRIAMNNDGSLAATAGRNEVTLWSATSDEPVWSQPAPGSFWVPVTFSPDGESIATADSDWHIVMRATDDGTLIWENDFDVRVRELCFAPNGSRVYAGFLDGTVLEIDAADGKTISTLAKLESDLERLVLAGAEGPLVACLEDGSGRVVGLDGNASVLLAGEPVGNSVAISADGRNLMHCAVEGVVELRQISDGALIKSRKRDLSCIPYSASADRAFLVARTDYGNTLEVWNLVSFEPIMSATLPQFMCVGGSADGRRAATMETNGSVRFWSLEDGKITPLDAPQVSPVHARWFPDGRRLLVGEASGRVSIRDSETLEELEFFQTVDSTAVRMLLSPRGDKLLVIDAGLRATLWDVATHEHVELGEQASRYSALQFTADGTRLYLSLNDEVSVFGTSDGSALATIPQTRDQLRFAVSPDGLRIALGTDELRVFSLPVTGEGELLTQEMDSLGLLEFSPDGALLAFGTDRSLRIWNVGTGELQVSQQTPSWMLKFNPRGDEFMLVDGEARLHRCDLLGNELELLEGAPHRPQEIAWSPDGRRVLMLGDRSAIHIWGLEK